MKKPFPGIVLVLSFIFTAVMSPEAHAVCKEKITTNSPYMNMPCPDDDPRWEQAFIHWSKRKETKEAMAALAIFEDMAADRPDNIEVGAWLGWAYYFAAMRNRSEREHYSQKGVAATEKVLAADPGNIYATMWRNTSAVLSRQVSEAEYADMRAYHKKFYHLRELPVPDNDPLWAEAMKLWDDRLTADDFDKVDEIIKGGAELTDVHMKPIQEKGKAVVAIFEELEKKYPDRIEPKLWLSRSHYWMSQVCVEPPLRAEWARAGMDWGAKTVEMEPRNAAANLFNILNMGEYSKQTSWTNIVRYSVPGGRGILAVVEEDPNYYYCAFSRYFASAIAVTGPLAFKVAELLGYPQEVIERLTDFSKNTHPNCLASYYSLADMYYALDRKEQGRKMLQTLLDADPTLLPYQAPENRITQLTVKRELNTKFK